MKKKMEFGNVNLNSSLVIDYLSLYFIEEVMQWSFIMKKD